MPPIPQRQCSYAGCRVLVPTGSGRCITHRAAKMQVTDRIRGSAASRGYGHKWRAARLGYLRTYPMCAMCAADGAATVATVVDHVVPHRGDFDLFWQRDNWQALCTTCHSSRKQALERAI